MFKHDNLKIDNGGTEKHRNWVKKNIYDSLLKQDVEYKNNL